MKTKKTRATKKKSVKLPRMSQSKRAGLIFPVARVHRKLKHLPQSVKRVSKGASVYMSAVLEYLIAEIAELSGNICKDYRTSRITPRHFFLATSHDQELDKLLNSVIIPGGGVVPRINMDLFRNVDTSVEDEAKSKRKPKKVNKAVSKVNKKSVDVESSEKKGEGITILSERTLNKGQKLSILNGDITNVVAAAIVHPTNGSFYLGGQVGSAISRKGGAEVNALVQDLHNKKGNLAEGSVDICDASKSMLCEKIIHVHSPSWDFAKQIERIDELTLCVKNILTLADTNKLKTIALPSISSGGNGFPKQLAAQTILRSINAYFRELDKAGTVNNSSIEQVYFVLYDAESVNIYTSELGKLDINSV